MAGWGALFGRKNEGWPPDRGDSGGSRGAGYRPSGFRPGGFRRTFAKASDAMAWFDGESLAETNPAWDRLFGRSEGECAGQPLSIFLPDAAWEGEEGFPNREFTGLKSDGTRLRLEAAGHPVAWEGRPGRMVVARDISERKAREEALAQSEASLRRSEGVLRSVLAHAPLAMLAWDREGCFTMAEGRGLEAMDLHPSALLGQSLFTRPSPAQALAGPVHRALEGREVDETVEIAGSSFELHLRAIAGGEGRAEGVLGLAMDVTERRRVEEDLRRSKEHLRTVISNAPLVLFALDAKGVFTLCEGRGLEAIGLKPGEVVGKSAFDIYKHMPQVRLNVRRALSGEEFTSTVELQGQWFETYFSPVFKGYDEVAGVIGVAINVDARHRAEEALRRSEEQLRNSRKMEAIGRVAGGVAHDFNNLLTAITGYAEILLSGGADAALQRKNLEEIRNAAERAAGLTRQLLAFSRKQVLTPKAMDLNRTVGEMDKMIRRLIREDIELVTMLEPRLGEVWADPGQMEQVILNLALNARDAMPRGGQLTIETGNVELDGLTARAELFLVPGPYVMLAVSDTGMGMDEEVKAHLFEPFFTTKEGGGQGLGLSAVYGIVKQSGGTLAVESEIGKGTTIRVFLPRLAREEEARGGERGSLKGVETVLLVEDEEAVRTLVREILRMHGYEVLEARHGGEAILISQRHQGPIHLLLTDMVMANMSGKELAEHLRPLRPEMHVLFISGYSEEQLGGMGGRTALPGESSHREGGGAFGTALGEAFLPKPFSPKTLAAKVREVLEGKAVERRDLAGQF
jgi:PAS domain S-box-containing protein